MSTENKKQDCLGFFGFLFGHNYEGRYNVSKLESKMHHVPPTPDDIGRLMGDVTDEQETLDKLEAMHQNGNDTSESVYVCDICTRCGHVVNP